MNIKKGLKNKSIYFLNFLKSTFLFRAAFSVLIFFKKRSFKEAYASIFPEIDTRMPVGGYLPVRLQIECTTRCNLACTMCSRLNFKGEEKDLDINNFKYIINQFPRLYNVWMLGLGENFLNKDFISMLEYMRSKDIKTCFIDNFTLIDEARARDLIRLKISQLWFSIESSNKGMYENIREGASFDEVVGNAMRLNELKKAAKADYPELGLYVAISNKNICEMQGLLELAIDIGAKNIIFCEEIGVLGSGPRLDRESFLKSLAGISKKAKKNSIKLVSKIKPIFIQNCTLPWIPCIDINGNVILACSYFGDRHIQTRFGNIFYERFEDIWNNKAYKTARKDARIRGSCKGNAWFECEKLSMQ